MAAVMPFNPRHKRMFDTTVEVIDDIEQADDLILSRCCVS